METYPIPPILGVAYHKATHSQRVAHMEALRGALIVCEKFISRRFSEDPELQTPSMREALITLSRVIESTPLNFP